MVRMEPVGNDLLVPMKYTIKSPTVGNRPPVIFVHEDNTTCISAVSTGKNPTMKTLERCFGVSLSWLNNRMFP